MDPAEMLAEVLRTADAIYVGVDHDPESVQVWVLGGDYAGQRVCRRTLAEALVALLGDASGVPTAKVCQACGELKGLEAYSQDRTAKDGRLKRCRVCERVRVREYDRRKRAERRRTP